MCAFIVVNCVFVNVRRCVYLVKLFLEMSVTPSQMQILVEFMDEHPELARGYVPSSSQGKQELNKVWIDLAGKLNADGLPSKTVTAWRKVWTDFKYRAKKKCSHNLLSMQKTGGGPSEEVPISDLEEKVIHITSLRTAVAGSSSHCFGAPHPQLIDRTNKMDDLEETLRGLVESPTKNTTAACKRSPTTSTSLFTPPMPKKPKKKENAEGAKPMTSILKEQIANDKQFQENLLKVLTERNQQELSFQEKIVSLFEKAVNYFEKK